MKNTATYRRSVAAASLVVTAVLGAVSLLTAPAFVSDPAEQLAAYAEAGGRAWVSGMAFTFAQLPFVAAVLGVGHLIRHGAPVLSNLGVSLAVAGAVGHATFGGLMLMTVSMADDASGRGVLAAAVADVESTPVMAFAAMGLVGTVLGLLLLGLGLWRAGEGPRWVPPVLACWLLVEFVGTGLSPWATPLSALLYVAALGALGVWVARTPEAAWRAPVDVPADAAAPSARVSRAG